MFQKSALDGVSDSAIDLISGLLRVDPEERYDLKTV